MAVLVSQNGISSGVMVGFVAATREKHLTHQTDETICRIQLSRILHLLATPTQQLFFYATIESLKMADYYEAYYNT